MKAPRWLVIDEVLAFHAKQVQEHGGLYGVRDHSLLEAALARPQHLFAYAKTDIFHLAAAYAVGITQNHPFIDGNKRTAITSAGVFLILNNYMLDVPEVEVVEKMTKLSAGDLKEIDFMQWLKKGSRLL